MYSQKDLSKKENEIRTSRFKTISFIKNLFSQSFGYSFLIFYVFISIVPFFWSFIVSFKNPHLLLITGINPFPSAGEWTTKNYTNLFSGAPSIYVNGWIMNTIVYAFGSSLLNATFNLLAGYALAQIAMKGKRLLMSYFLVSILIPSQATFLPTFYIFSKLGIISQNIGTSLFLFAVVFSGMANIILTFMARQFFLTQTSELEEAASMEGYTRIGVFFKITLRKMLPLFATQFVLVFMGAWNNYLTFTLYALGDPNKMTINTGILIVAKTTLDKEIGYGQMLAMSNISFIPMMFLYAISLKIQLRGIKGGNK